MNGRAPNKHNFLRMGHRIASDITNMAIKYPILLEDAEAWLALICPIENICQDIRNTIDEQREGQM